MVGRPIGITSLREVAHRVSLCHHMLLCHYGHSIHFNGTLLALILCAPASASLMIGLDHTCQHHEKEHSQGPNIRLEWVDPLVLNVTDIMLWE